MNSFKLSRMRRLAACILAVLMALTLTACGPQKLQKGAVTDSEGVLCFDFSPSDFVSRCNDLLPRGASMRPYSGWVSLTESEAGSPFIGWDVRRFKQDESCWTDPAVMLYPSSDGKHVRAVTFDLDDHAYTEQSFSEYRRYCIAAIRLLAGIGQDDAEDVFDSLYREAAEGRGWYPDESGTVPRYFWFYGDAGFFPYFRNGCMLRICAVPMDETSFNRIYDSGAEIHYADRTYTDGTDPAPAPQAPVPDVPLDASAVTTAQDQTVFAFTGEDLVSVFNTTYGEDFFRPLEQWEQPEDEELPQGIAADRILRFRHDAESWTDPTVTLYLSDENVSALSFDFNEHNYTENGLAMFRDTFVRSMGVMTGCDDAAAHEMYDGLYGLVDQGECSFEPDEQIRPLMMYRCGSVGVYPAYRAGMIRFIAVPIGEGDNYACGTVDLTPA